MRNRAAHTDSNQTRWNVQMVRKKERRKIMKLVCNGQHWKIKDKQLVLDTPDGQNAVQRVMAVLEAKIRLEIYEQICDMNLLDNRKAIVKAGVDNVALSVQALIADKVLGK
jgi:hypothetical protein